MQGRLTEPNGRGIQFFPFDNWKQEFIDAEEIGLQEIEWIFDYDDYKSNPLWTEKGCNEISDIINQTGIKVNTVCLDYFMRRPFFKEDNDNREETRRENEMIITRIVENMQHLGIKLIEIPFVDASSIKNSDEEKMVSVFLSDLVGKISEDMHIGVESDYSPGKFGEFIRSMNNTRIVANYDSGNSSGLGYDSEKEIIDLDRLLYNFHVKDRVTGGTTVKLGTGDADFDKTFSALKRIHYNRAFILQAARGKTGSEKATIRDQFQFVNNYVEEYRLGE